MIPVTVSSWIASNGDRLRSSPHSRNLRNLPYNDSNNPESTAR